MKITNKELIQSYVLTTARYDFSVYEKRILYRIVETCQHLLEGEKLNNKVIIEKDLYGDRKFTMPLSLFLGKEEDKNYVRIKKALTSLNEKKFEYEDAETWTIIRLIEKPELKKIRGSATFEVRKELYEAILSFSKGFRKYELKTAMEFQSVYSMRFYELFSGLTKPITYSIIDLKVMFQIQDKYSKSGDFIIKVIKPAQKELDKLAPYSFTFKPNKIRKKIVSITFKPKLNPENVDAQLETKKLQKQVDLSWDLTPMLTDYLKENYFFSTQEIKNNMELWMQAQKNIPELMTLLADNRRKASDKKNPKGWIIGVIKKNLK